MNLRIKGLTASPSVRFKSLPDLWKAGEVRQYASLVGGLTYTPADVAPEGLLVLRSSNIQNGVIELKDNVFVDLQVSENALSQPEDILVCVRNGSRKLIGKTALLPEELPRSTHGAFMSLIRGKHNRFLFQQLQTSRYHRQVHINLGATINSINGSALRAFQFYFPTLPEQRKIADFLTAVDGRIGQLIQKKALLEDYKKGVMQQLFTQAIRFKDDHGNDFPEWEEKKLGEVTKWASGGTPSKDNASFWEGDIPWMSAASMHERYYSDSPLRISKEGVKSGSKMALEGTLLLLVRGSMLWNRIPVGITTRDVAFNQDVKALTPTGKVLAGFLLQWFIASENMLLHKVVGTGIGAGKLDTDEMKSLRFRRPTPDEQTKIADFLSALDRKIEGVATQITETQTFKRGLLQQMFV